ncbi:MAG TPA: chloride channel protein [Acidimicrobiales bacterium]|jgi:CIC family chloride channel protein|nr:chloride channel protein [Acidimicrobiales bacterium]
MRFSALEVVPTWLRGSRLGLVVMALVVGVGAGFGAVAFRWLIFAFTWLATGREQFGQQGRVASLHLPWLGVGFFLLIPVVGGLLYGPLIQRFAPEARGHGVPEVMLAVADNGGRIRPQVSVVKALASAICISAGGSVGREGPIVQVGAAFASSLGQLVKMSKSRLRIIVACGAAGGIAATFNAPLTGVLFALEIVLRELSLDALFATILSAVSADLVSRAFFGSAPFFSQLPHDLSIVHDPAYLLIGVLGLLAGLVGVGFKSFLYGFEDVADRIWKGRPEWARPAVGGVALGVLLLALPQMYGVGYPVMDKIIAGHDVLWLIVILMVGKIVASSLTLSIGGSGGVFAPSLFIGAAGGMAYGVTVHHLFGSVVGPPAIYAVVGMGGVFAGATQSPLTAIGSVVEMTGNFTLMLPVMLAAGIAAVVSKRLSYGSIYTTKLLRRGIDIERPKTTSVLQVLTVGDVMQPFPHEHAELVQYALAPNPSDVTNHAEWEALVGPVTVTRRPQTLMSDENLEQALRQLELYGPDGLPVLSPDRRHLTGWVSRRDVRRAVAQSLIASTREAEEGALASDLAAGDPESHIHEPPSPLDGYDVIEITVGPESPQLGRSVGEVPWPPGCFVVAVIEGREIVSPRSDIELRLGDRVILLAPTANDAAIPQVSDVANNDQ